MTQFAPPYLIVSATHDYRTKRRVDLHFIADELARRGETMFLSTHSSALSRLRGRDRRHALPSGGRVTASGVHSYLWHGLLHPLNVRARGLSGWNSAANALYRRMMPGPVANMITRARTIIVESGSSVALIAEIVRRNPAAAIIYSASDTLRTIGMAEYYDQALCAAAAHIAYVRLPSARMADDHACIKRQRVIPHGLDAAFFSPHVPDPYAGRRAAVAVGSMLFDPSFFDIAAARYPDVDFWVIGSGHSGTDRANLHWLPETSFADTIGYIRHAALGIAPYRSALTADYLVDTSMKLMQFEAAGIPAVCPDFAQGGREMRFGYTVGDPASIVTAIDAALAHGPRGTGRPRTWNDVVEEMLLPIGPAQ